MRNSVRIVIAILLSLAVIGAVTVLAFTNLFSLIESGIYYPNLKAEAEKEVLDLDIRKIQNQTEVFLNDIRENLEKLYQLKRTLGNKIVLAEEMIANTREEAEIKADLYRERRLPNRDYLAALEAMEQAEVFAKELRYRLEQVNIRINTLIGREES